MKLEQIKEKIQSGDFVTLSKMLRVTQGNARMMFNRGKLEAIDGMIKIIKQRESLIDSYETKD